MISHVASSEGARPGRSVPEPFRGPGEALRWEWRTFEYRQRLWQDAMRDAVMTSSRGLSSETYFVSRRSPVNVKVREDCLEVKELLTVDSHGLELWRPTIKAAFPLQPNVLDELFDAWQVSRPISGPVLSIPEDLCSFLSQTTDQVRVVAVRKWRRRFKLNGCSGERVTILLEGRLLEGLALEHEDPQVLRETLATLNLAGARNTNYVLAIKEALEWVTP